MKCYFVTDKYVRDTPEMARTSVTIQGTSVTLKNELIEIVFLALIDMNLVHQKVLCIQLKRSASVGTTVRSCKA